MNKNKRTLILLPLFGTILFVGLYLVSTHFYPGGSQIEKKSIGSSWKNNYWCNLLNENAINGQHNSAQPIALTGMFVLCLTLTAFWLFFPRLANMGSRPKALIQISGTSAMVAAGLLFTSMDHDLVTNIASMFGLIATVGTLIGLYQNKWHRLLVFGFLNILLVVVNNYVYYIKDLIIYLPIIQKISFASFLIWICSIDIHLYRNAKEPLTKTCLTNALKTSDQE